MAPASQEKPVFSALEVPGPWAWAVNWIKDWAPALAQLSVHVTLAPEVTVHTMNEGKDAVVAHRGPPSIAFVTCVHRDHPVGLHTH